MTDSAEMRHARKFLDDCVRYNVRDLKPPQNLLRLAVLTDDECEDLAKTTTYSHQEIRTKFKNHGFLTADLCGGV